MPRALAAALLVCAAAALAPAPGFADICSPSVTRICLQGSRFGVEVAWTLPGGITGVGHASPMTNDTGLFWFFSDSNLELVVKVLDGRAINGHFWVYYGGLSDVEYTITVTDSKTGATEIYHNPASRLASGSDTSAFAAEPLAAGGTIRSGMLGGASPTTEGKATTVAAVPLRQGSELPVNVTTQGMQLDPDVAIGSDGGSMVVWMGQDAAPNYLNAYGRFYDAAGHPRGGEVRLNETEDVVGAWQVRVAAAAGVYMAVWENLGDASFVAGRIYGVDGQPRSGEFKIHLPGPGGVRHFQHHPGITAADGTFVVGWVDDTVGVPNKRLLGQRFNLQGEPVGGTFAISDTTSAGEGPRLAASPAGGFVATWTEWIVNQTRDTVPILMARRFDSTSQAVGDPIEVATPSSLLGSPRLAPALFHADGSFSVLWTMSRLPTQVLYARRYSSAGMALGETIEVQQDVPYQTPAAALLPSGDALVLWHTEGRPEDPDGGVMARVFDSSWTPRGAAFRINSFTLSEQSGPALASDASGHLMAVWNSGIDPYAEDPVNPVPDNSQDGSSFGVFAQSFTTASCALASNQLCLNGRFRVDVQFTDPRTGDPEAAQAVPLTSDTGAFWFFGANNLELLLKVLDGRALNGHFWVYAGALSDVAYTITLTDTATGQVRTYRNDLGHLASRADVEAF